MEIEIKAFFKELMIQSVSVCLVVFVLILVALDVYAIGQLLGWWSYAIR